MKLSTYIKILSKLLEKHGELELCVSDWANHEAMFNKAAIPKVISVKKHYRSFYRSNLLQNGGYAGGQAFTQPYQKQMEAKPDQKIIWIGAS